VEDEESADEHGDDGERSSAQLRAPAARDSRIRCDPVNVIVSTVVVNSETAGLRAVVFWTSIAKARSRINA
jgi:hypothetical protein